METVTARAMADPAAMFYRGILSRMENVGVRYAIGGALAVSHYSKVPRDTKDLDIFVKRSDCPRVLEAFAANGYTTETPFPHWLAKIRQGQDFVDVIYSSGNGLTRVDDLWFDHAPKADVLGMIVPMVPPEEMIWSKAFVQDLMRFGDHWRVLLSHLILFGFVYPDKRQIVPEWVMEELVRRLSASRPNPANDICYGTLLSREQYLDDLTRLKYRDARAQPLGGMTEEEIQIWTDAIPRVDRPSR